MTAPRPGCFVESGAYGDLQITAVPGDVVWPCVKRESNTTRLTMDSDSSVAWRVTTNPAWNATGPTAYTVANLLAVGAWQALSPTARTEALLLPGETAAFDIAAPPTSTDPDLSQKRTLALGLGFFLPDEIVDTVGRSECLPDLIRSGVISDKPSATDGAH